MNEIRNLNLISLLSLYLLSRGFTRSPRKLGLTASLLSLYLLSRGFTPLQ